MVQPVSGSLAARDDSVARNLAARRLRVGAAGGSPLATTAETQPGNSLDVLHANGQPRDSVLSRHASAEPAAASASANNSAESSALAEVTARVKQQLLDIAADSDAFHALMSKSFGDGYDRDAAETMRQEFLRGDFSSLPRIEVVDAAVLEGGSGAYIQQSNTILISRELLLADANKATAVLLEEVGHGIDAKINTQDAAGDEGEIFARLAAGKELTAAQLQELRAENDHGTITVNGEEVQVEFFFKKIFKGIKKAFKGIGKAIKGAFKAVWNGFKKIMASGLFDILATVLMFIPGMQIISLGMRMVSAAYKTYQGIKHGSLSMVLSGVAGLAGAGGKFAGALGAAKTASTLSNVATWANRGARVYSAYAKRDFGAAAGVFADIAGVDTTAGKWALRAQRADAAVKAAENGDGLTAVALTSGLVAEIPGASGNNFIVGLRNHSNNLAVLRNQVENDKYGLATRGFLGTYGASLGIDADTQANLVKFADVIEGSASLRQKVIDKDYVAVAREGSEILGIEPDNGTLQNLIAVLEIREDIKADRYGDAVNRGAGIARRAGNDELATDLETLSVQVFGKVDPENPDRRIPGLYDNYEAVRDLVRNGDDAGAARVLLTNYGSAMGIKPEAQTNLLRLIDVVDGTDNLRQMFKEGKVPEAAAQFAEIMGIEPDNKTMQQISTILTLREQMTEGQTEDALRTSASLAAQAGDEELAANLIMLADMLFGKEAPAQVPQSIAA